MHRQRKLLATLSPKGYSFPEVAVAPLGIPIRYPLIVVTSPRGYLDAERIDRDDDRGRGSSQTRCAPAI